MIENAPAIGPPSPPVCGDSRELRSGQSPEPVRVEVCTLPADHEEPCDYRTMATGGRIAARDGVLDDEIPAYPSDGGCLTYPYGDHSGQH